MDTAELQAAVKRVVTAEFGGDPVRRIEANLIVDEEGEPIWHVVVVLKKALDRHAPVLEVIQKANDWAERMGSPHFVLFDYATEKEVRERVA